MKGLGAQGEAQAIVFFEKKGCKILKRNFRSPRGEVDIIVKDGDCYVFVEVKTWRTCSEEDLEFSISRKKQQRIIFTARYYLSVNNLDEVDVRFDVVFIQDSKLDYYKNAFSESY